MSRILDEPPHEQGSIAPKAQSSSNRGEHISKLKADMAFAMSSAPVVAAASLGLKPIHSKLLEVLCEHNRTPSHEAADDLTRYMTLLLQEHPPMSSPFQPAEQEQ